MKAELRELDIAQGIDPDAPIVDDDREEYDDVAYFPLTTPDEKLADLPRIADEHAVIIYITNEKGRGIAAIVPAAAAIAGHAAVHAFRQWSAQQPG